MVIFALVGLVLFFIFFSFVLSNKAKKREKIFVPVQKTEIVVSDGFKSREGNFANQRYAVSVQSVVHDGGKIYSPIGGCSNFLAVDLKFKINKPDTLKEKLVLIQGVRVAEVSDYKIIVHRPCISAKDLPELWSWDDVWKNVKEVLVEYYK